MVDYRGAMSLTTVNDVVATMSSITESSRRITDIIGVINSIAFQTNILGKIAAASDESSRGIGQIGQALAEMDGVT